jgi:hypothetical protein
VIEAGPALAAVADRLGLDEALATLARSDLLPPRVEDKVAGQLRAGFLAALKASLVDGSYRPVPADLVLVPKPRFASRPAALLSLEDRVVFAALVAAVGSKIDRVLDDADRVYWPRGTPASGRWKEFERAPLDAHSSHVVLADVAGFYESVDHARLRRVLIATSGSTPIADALAAWLAVVMGSTRGLPQGYPASDHLATIYLAEADATVARGGYLLHRHGDDFRIPAQDYPDALRAAHVVEQGLRRCLLLPNSSKLVIETAEHYAEDLARTDEDSEELRQELMKDAAERLLADGYEVDAYYLLERLGIEVEPTGSYREGTSASPEDLAELEVMVTPSTTARAWALLDNAMLRRPGTANRGDLLSNGHFHERVASALPVLAGSKDPQALIHCPVLLTRHGDETALVSNYLAALTSVAPEEVRKICLAVLASETFMLGWQRAWLWNTLGRVDPEHLDREVLALAAAVAGSDGGIWLERVEAVKVMAVAGSLDRPLLLSLWERAPAVYQADLIAAAAMLTGSWAARFLSTARQHPVHQVVRSNVLSALPTASEPPASGGADSAAETSGLDG